MKKLGINIIIGSAISIILIVLAKLIIKPNYTYLTAFNDHVYSSRDKTSFSYDNNTISYKKLDDRLTIESSSEDTSDISIVRFYEDGRTIMAVEHKIIEGYIEITVDKKGNEHASCRFEEALNVDDMLLFLKYSVLFEIQRVDNDRINVTNQKIICAILSVFIAFILSFLAYPVILFNKIKESKNLALILIPSTLILCILSAFYIYFTLK